jgi:hypothetical protein
MRRGVRALSAVLPRDEVLRAVPRARASRTDPNLSRALRGQAHGETSPGETKRSRAAQESGFE